MLLEDPHSIDLSVKPNNGYLAIPIIDAGITIDINVREELFNKKLENTRSFLSTSTSREDEGFEEEFPGMDIQKVSIIVYYKNFPTKNMLKKSSLELYNKYDGVSIPVVFEVLAEKNLNEHQRKELDAYRNKKWWQFWI